MPGEYAIDVRDVTKIYKLYDKPIDRLKESLNPLHRNYHRDFYALNHISFQVKKGETLCLIEAMKMMSEVPAPADCVVEEVLGRDGEVEGLGDGPMDNPYDDDRY